MKKFTTIILESIFVGVALIAYVYITAFILKLFKYPRPTLPDVCSSWNNTYVMEVNIFLAGLLFHLTFEYLNFNKWYVDNYYMTK